MLNAYTQGRAPMFNAAPMSARSREGVRYK
jgi:hypothetical protein